MKRDTEAPSERSAHKSVRRSIDSTSELKQAQSAEKSSGPGGTGEGEGISSAGWHEKDGARGERGVVGGGGEAGACLWIGEGDGVDEGGKDNQYGPPATGIRSLVGTGSPATTGCPFRRARNGTAARTCRVIPRHRIVDRSRKAFIKKSLLDTTRSSLKFCNFIKQSGGSRPSAAKRLVAHRHESARTCAGVHSLRPTETFSSASIHDTSSGCTPHDQPTNHEDIPTEATVTRRKRQRASTAMVGIPHDTPKSHHKSNISIW